MGFDIGFYLDFLGDHGMVGELLSALMEHCKFQEFICRASFQSKWTDTFEDMIMRTFVSLTPRIYNFSVAPRPKRI
jgi:hypothetical protein